MISSPLSVDAVRFNQLLWNATLFTNKTGATEGRVFFSLRVGEHWDITMFACDDFIVVQDSIPFGITEQENAVVIEPLQFTMSLADVKELEKQTREFKEQFIFTIVDDALSYTSGDDVHEFPFEGPSQVWGYLIEVAEAGQQFSADFTGTTFYINPDRLKQIPRMKIDGDHPLAFRYGRFEDQQMIGFRYGPLVRGTITSMDVAVLKERAVHIWPGENEEGVSPHVVVTESVTTDEDVTPFDHGDPAEPPPWDVDGPTNLDTEDKLAHVDKDQMREFGF